MTSRTINKFSPEVCARAVRMVLDHEKDHPSRWAAVVSIAAKIGCAGQTLHEWVMSVPQPSTPSPDLQGQRRRPAGLYRRRHYQGC